MSSMFPALALDVPSEPLVLSAARISDPAVRAPRWRFGNLGLHRQVAIGLPNGIKIAMWCHMEKCHAGPAAR